jgi:hypothetical protein
MLPYRDAAQADRPWAAGAERGEVGAWSAGFFKEEAEAALRHEKKD